MAPIDRGNSVNQLDDFDTTSHGKSSIGIGIVQVSDAAYGDRLYVPQQKSADNAYTIPTPLPPDTPFPFSRLNACTAGSTALAIVYAWHSASATYTAPAAFPSIPFIFYYARYLEGVEASDVGVTINSAIRACVTRGFCNEDQFQAATANANDKPTTTQISAAVPNAVLDYKLLRRDPGDIASCIAGGRPVLMRIVVDEQKTEEVQWGPGQFYSFGSNAKGHCVLAVGFDETDSDPSKHFLWVRDTAGPDVSQQGYRPIYYTDVTDPTHTSDFWTLFQVTPQPQSSATPQPALQTTDVAAVRKAYADNAKDFRGWVKQALYQQPGT